MAPDLSNRIIRDLLEWYDHGARDLPWRRSRDPYAVWVSEVMLQQTQIATALPYYEAWMRRFPTVQDLAAASETEALAHWQGLGYYRRCRQLQQAAQIVASEGFPSSRVEWRALPGIGAYTSAAIASIVSNEPAAAVDGNVERVYARFTRSTSVGDQLRREAEAWSLSLIPADRAGDWNQALMELGATVCRPRSPLCSSCPIRSSCACGEPAIAEAYPAKAPKPAVKSVMLHTYVPWCEGKFGVRPVPEGTWWQGLQEFPTASETPWPIDQGALLHAGGFSQVVTNHRIRFDVSLLLMAEPDTSLAWHREEDLTHVPLAAPMRKALKLARQTLAARLERSPQPST